MQRGCGFFNWFDEEIAENTSQVLLNRLESLSKDFEKLRFRNEEIGNTVTEIQVQLNKMWKWKIICFVMLCIWFFRLF